MAKPSAVWLARLAGRVLDALGGRMTAPAAPGREEWSYTGGHILMSKQPEKFPKSPLRSDEPVRALTAKQLGMAPPTPDPCAAQLDEDARKVTDYIAPMLRDGVTADTGVYKYSFSVIRAALKHTADAARAAQPDDLRAQGWRVGVHNDYYQNGQPRTFWLMTNDGRVLEGEGATDAEALNAIRAQAPGEEGP